MLLDELAHDRGLDLTGGSESIAHIGFGGGVDQAFALGQGDPHLDAVGGCDVALRLDVLPRRVVPLGPDQAEDVALTAVLADQRGGQPQPAAGLQVGRHPEDRRRQQVHLVIDDQAPVAGVEQLKVRVDTLAPQRQYLVRRDGDRAHLLAGAGVLADLVVGERGALDQLIAPLAGRDGVGDQDQRGGLGPGHRARTDQGLTGATGQDDDARTAVPEVLDGLDLVGP